MHASHDLHGSCPDSSRVALVIIDMINHFNFPGFFATALDVLLRYLDVEWLVLTGIRGDVCVLSTAHDAHMRDYGLVVPEDCIASCNPEENEHALAMMRDALHVETMPSDRLDFACYLDPAHESPRERGGR